MAFPIVEYQTSPEWVSEIVADSEKMRMRLEWGAKIAIDLRWVATAKPYFLDQASAISLCGSGQQELVVSASYEDFMRDWVRAKGL